MKLKMAKGVLIALAVTAGHAAQAQYKCKQLDGATTYQQTPCSQAASSRPLQIFPSGSPAPAGAGERKPDWSAIARGEPAVGMTAKELEQAMGRPNRANLAQYGSNTADQLIYYRGNRTLYVYVRDGVVTSVQSAEGGEVKVGDRAVNDCPTPRQIRDLEFEASKLQNQNNTAVHEALAKARSCRP